MLDNPITKLPRLTEAHKLAFKRLGIQTYRDLLYHIPVRYNNLSEIRTIQEVAQGDEVTLYGKLTSLQTRKGFGGSPNSTRAILSDHTGQIKLVWFHQPYIAKMYTEDSIIKISGKVSGTGSTLSIVNPTINNSKNLPIDSGNSLFKMGDTHTQIEAGDEYLQPIYNETKDITSLYIYHQIQKLVSNGILQQIVDPIPEYILKKYHLPTLSLALTYIHFPKTADHVTVARKRLAFEEIFFIQLQRAKERLLLADTPGFVIDRKNIDLDFFISKFPFPLTDSQTKAIDAIFTDTATGTPMSRLLEGDVGSGKTAVAAIAAFAAATTRPYLRDQKKTQEFGTLQVAYMAPTEILAKQHFDSFCEYFAGSGLSIALITGSGCRKYPSKSRPGTATDISRTQLSKWVENGEIAIVIGTHALIQKNVIFKHLALCIIDEQHRFGVKQRKALTAKKGAAGIEAVPHLLSMTATPIPRTLALTIYGDLDLTLLDEMPLGRKKIMTEIVTPLTRDDMYKKVQAELDSGRQAYVICPRIDEADENKAKSLQLKSVTTEAARLQNTVFKKNTIGVLHGKMRPAEKDSVMKDFAEGKIDILVATSVVEVGVSVANATVIVIEGADRFGLSQLHQLRGRVVRGTHQPYCFVCSDNASEKTLTRLHSLVTAKNGFELAEMDLSLRGAGGLTQGKQWGVSDTAMEAIKNIKLVEAARTEARALITKDFTLASVPELQKTLAEREKTHLE
ncbi:MAG: ATP-dependent helicase RecG, ATP-dependent helicase RecG [Candidatus Parcubacteria bacterium]|jgi:ATP-dependent DNA helicase RecG